MNSMVKQIDAAIESHKLWKTRLADAVNREACGVSFEDIGADTTCAFGQWLYGNDISDSERQGDAYAKVQTWHALFHKEASHVVELVRQGRVAEAKLAMDEEGRRYYQVSAVLLQLIEEWKEKVAVGQ
jgi:hypothetical protein